MRFDPSKVERWYAPTSIKEMNDFVVSADNYDTLLEMYRELERKQYVEKADSVCIHCGERIFWWPLSHMWSHETGANMGLTNCYGKHAPALGITNAGPFAESAL